MKLARRIGLGGLLGILFVTCFLVLLKSGTSFTVRFGVPRDTQIPKGGISPNGQFAFALLPADKAFHDIPGTLSTAGTGPLNYLVTHSIIPFTGNCLLLPSEIYGCVDDRNSGGAGDGIVRWAKDSSALLVFSNVYRMGFTGIFSLGASRICVVPFINGNPGKITILGNEILKASHPDFEKAHDQEIQRDLLGFDPYDFGSIADGGLDDDLTFNDANQIVIDCWCTNQPKRDSHEERYTVHVTGLWDPIQGKFVKVSCERVASPQ